MVNLGILGSTNGTDLQTILDSIELGSLNAKVSIVISNKKDAYILKRAKKYNVPTAFIPHKGKKRKNFDFELTTILKHYNVELILLIGFMRILSPYFCKEWNQRILNVHPSLLPKYAGGMDNNIHAEVLKNKDKETGCTIHFVTDTVDEGPIIIQKRCKVNPGDTISSLKSKVQKLEGLAFLEVIPLFDHNG